MRRVPSYVQFQRMTRIVASPCMGGVTAMFAVLLLATTGASASAETASIAYVSLSRGFQAPFLFQAHTQPETLVLSDGRLAIVGPRNRRAIRRYGSRPSWSRRGDRLAFVRADNRGIGIWTMRSDGRDMRLLYRPHGNSDAGVDAPAWAPDDSAVVFQRSRWKRRRSDEIPAGSQLVSDLWMIRRDGRGLRRLTHTGLAAAEPSWGPDGRIAFVARGPAGNWNVFVINGDGTGLTRVTTAPGDHRDPEWSPDGTRIAFSIETADRIDIYTIGRDGMELHKLTTAASEEANTDPSWARDGTAIAFSAWGPFGNDHEIVATSVHGGAPRQLTANRVDDVQPAWGPSA